MAKLQYRCQNRLATILIVPILFFRRSGTFDEDAGDSDAQANQVVVVLRMFSIHTKMIQASKVEVTSLFYCPELL